MDTDTASITKTFTTGQIVSAGTGHLCCTMGEVYEILSHLTGESIHTHQIPRALQSCQEYMRTCFPWLLTLDLESLNRETYTAWRAAAEEKHGATHELAPMPVGWVHKHPLQELMDMAGPTKVVVISIGTKPGSSSQSPPALPS